MKIVLIFICAFVALVANFKIKYSSNIMGKLINGMSVDHGNYKFIGSLRRENVHFCTVSLLSNKISLTTATCLKDFLTQEEIPEFDLYTIMAGRFDLPGKSAVFLIEEVRIHRRYHFNNPKTSHDIGMVTMRDNNVTESEYVGWALWSGSDGTPNVAKGELALWENINETNKIQKTGEFTLKKMAFERVKNAQCGLKPNVAIICAKSLTENTFLSNGDIGAPFTQGKIIKGIVAIIPDELNKPFILIDIYKAYWRIQNIFTDCPEYYRTRLPRKRAKNDPIFTNLSEDRRVKLKHDGSETNDVLD